MDPIKPSKALYVKLGKGGTWERDCLTREQTLRLGYEDVPHDLCLNAAWREATEDFRRGSPAMSGATVTNHMNQVRLFYESGDDVLWVTFFGDLLWWCFSRREITQLPDGTKTRPAIDQWRSADILGRPLSTARLSGKLLSMQGFRGTICAVDAFEYLVNKINGVEHEEVRAATHALSELERRLEELIRRLRWRDFEILMDLVFRQAGWQRIGQAGGAQKTLDLDLISPITGERFGVQIKSQAGLADFRAYEERFRDLQGFARCYFVVHSPRPDLAVAGTSAGDACVLWLPSAIAGLAVKYGLVSWIIDKAG
ncbi:MAG: hypothetical protein ACRD1X_07945 [Vicinamibacteria bacterium]